MIKYFLLLICFITPISSMADDYYSEHEQGWFWFDDPKQKEVAPQTQHQTIEQDPIVATNQVRKKIKAALDQAILDPTSEHVQTYISLQNQMSERANQFANMWQEVLLNHPELNYSIQHPTNNIALQVYHENESADKAAALRQFSEHTGLFFFYRSTCPYCRRFAPILKHFAEQHHIVIVPITLDGVSLPEFPNSKQDSGQAEQFQVEVEPSLYAVDPISQKAFPVAFGLTSETELENNIYNIVTHYQAGLS